MLGIQNRGLVGVFAVSACLTVCLTGCAQSSSTPATASPDSSTQKSPAAGTVSASLKAEVGHTAPDFTLKDLDGKDVSLQSYRGKTVVLEWFNPGCPFVKASHTKGSLVDAAKKATQSGVVWLSINSAGEGKQGFGADASRDGAKMLGVDNPILLDTDGKVGHAYGATNTPHLFVIDSKGTLVYAGAPDNSPDGAGDSPEGGKLVSYIDQTLAEIAAGKPVSVPSSKAYGCSVKYGS